MNNLKWINRFIMMTLAEGSKRNMANFNGIYSNLITPWALDENWWDDRLENNIKCLTRSWGRDNEEFNDLLGPFLIDDIFKYSSHRFGDHECLILKDSRKAFNSIYDPEPEGMMDNYVEAAHEVEHWNEPFEDHDFLDDEDDDDEEEFTTVDHETSLSMDMMEQDLMHFQYEGGLTYERGDRRNADIVLHRDAGIDVIDDWAKFYNRMPSSNSLVMSLV